MPVGPQRRSGFPNRVDTPHGQVLGRKSDTAYSHAVVRTVPMEAHRSRLEEQSTFYHGLIEKYGSDVDPRYHKEAKKLTKTLGSLPDASHFSEVVSMHTGSSQAEARRKRESNKGVRASFSVLPTRQDD